MPENMMPKDDLSYKNRLYPYHFTEVCRILEYDSVDLMFPTLAYRKTDEYKKRIKIVETLTAKIADAFDSK